jgi:hypothetical protein
MVEEGNAAASEGEGDGTLAAPVALADENGVLRDGWLDSIDEDLREESYLKEAKDVQSLARSTVHARRMVGKDKMVIPNEDSGDEVWDAYHKIGGRPDTALDYGFKRPDDFPEEHWDDEFMTKAQDILHKGGASKKLADDLLALNIESSKAALEKQRQQEEYNLDEINKKLDVEWGLARDQKMHLGNIAVVEGTKNKDGTVDEERKARILEKVNADPDLIWFASNLGGKFSEHGVIHDTGIPTPGDLQAQIDEEMAKPVYSKDWRKNGFTKEAHQRQVNLVAKLFQDKVASTKTG